MALVLVVEDYEPTCRGLARLLKMVGHRAQCVMDGQTALEFCKSAPPCLVILDLMLPDISGFDVLKSLRADPATATIPVLVYTALGDRSTREQVLASGAQGLLVKAQSSFDEVSEMVGRFISQCP